MVSRRMGIPDRSDPSIEAWPPIVSASHGAAAFEVLEPAGAELVAEGVAAETRRGYAGDLGRYGAWCSQRGLAPIPASAERLVNYVAHLAAENKAPSSIERALAAVLSAHRLAGAARPDTKAARTAIKALRRRPPRRASPSCAGWWTASTPRR